MDTIKQREDDLTQLKGIGEKRQTWLRETMHIYNFEDLAATSADALQKQLLEASQPVSIDTIRAWTEQARKLASQRQLDKPDQGKSTPEKDSTTRVQKTEQDWQPLASFVIEYQECLIDGEKQYRTSAHHVEADNSETWPGVIHEQLHDWMVKQAGLESQIVVAANKKEYREDEIITVKKEHIVIEDDVPLNLKIKQLLVYQVPKFDQPAAVGEPERPFLGNVQAESQCVFAVLYETSDSNGDASRSHNILAQLYARNMTTHTLIGVPANPESKSISVDKTKHKIEFSQTSLPAGAYRFEITLRENKPFSPINYMKFPVLNIL